MIFSVCLLLEYLWNDRDDVDLLPFTFEANPDIPADQYDAIRTALIDAGQNPVLAGDYFSPMQNDIFLGTRFALNDIAGTELWIDGMKQETISVSENVAAFKLTGVKSNSSSDIKFYTAEGSPSGTLSNVSFDAGLLSISPSVGSSGGTLITVTGVGFGPGNQNSVNLYHLASA